MRTPISFRRNVAGATFVETAFAVGLLGVFISALLVLGSNLLGLLRSSQANISANQVLHERMETIREANWLQLTDPGFLSTKYLVADAKSGAGLSHPIETLTVSAFPAKTGVVTQIVRENHVTRVVTSSPL